MKTKVIKGYEKLYTINENGEIYSIRSRKFLKQSETKSGYKTITLYKDGKRKTYLVHRLVAQAFLRKNYDKTEVNHKNEIKSDNQIENLEWCTHVYNCNYGTKPSVSRETSYRYNVYSILQETKDNELIYYRNANATKEFGYIPKEVIRHCNLSTIYENSKWYYYIDYKGDTTKMKTTYIAKVIKQSTLIKNELEERKHRKEKYRNIHWKVNDRLNMYKYHILPR